MLLGILLCWTLTCMLFTTGGSAPGQTSPENCVRTFRIEQDSIDIYITPGVVNCFSCTLDTIGTVMWLVTLNDTSGLVPFFSLRDASTVGNLLTITTPGNYVLPGISGMRDIVCISLNNSQNLTATLASPVLVQPSFPDATVNEGELLNITCTNRNIPDITTLQILDPSGVSVSGVPDSGVLTLVFSVPEVTRASAGNYTCVILSTIDNSTANATSKVIIQYAAEVTPANSSTHEIFLGKMFRLQCSYAGVPFPTVQWFHNDTLLTRGEGVIIIGGFVGDNNYSSIEISFVHRVDKGNYTCFANNSLGSAHANYTVHILETPPQFVNPQHPNVYIYETDMNSTQLHLFLPCPIVDPFMVTFTWFRENRTLSQNMINSSGNLTILNITEGEYANRTGVHYYCVATKIIGRNYSYEVSVRSRTITVFYAHFDGFRQAVEQQVSVSVAIGSDVALECDVLPANPPPLIRWLRDGSIIAENRRNNVVRFLDSGRYLYMRRLTQSDLASSYRCEVTNAFLDRTMVAPTTYRLIDNLTRGVLVDYKQIGNLTAFVGNTSFEFAYVGGIFSNNSENNGTTNILHVSRDGVEIANIGNVASVNTISSVGTFNLSALVTFNGVNVDRYGTLVVHRLPFITSSVTDIRELEVGEYKYTCEFEGSPSPSIEWYFNGQPIPSGHGVIISGNNITIPSPQVSHSGIYQCIVRSEFGDDQAAWLLEIAQSNTRYCDAENVSTENVITYFWPRTHGGETATISCPVNSNILVMRNCSNEGSWQRFIEDGCETVNEQLERLNTSFANLTNGTYGNAVAMLSQIIELTENNTVEQTSEVLSQVASYLEDLADFVNESDVIINTVVVEDVVNVVHSLLQWEPENIMVSSSSSVVQSFETIASIYAQQLTLNETQNFTTPSLTLVAELKSVDRLIQTGRSFFIGGSDHMLASGDQVKADQLESQLDAAIGLPASLFERINDRDTVGVFFAFYKTPNLFPVSRELTDKPGLPRRNVVGSHILAATVGPGINFQNLDDPVTIALRLQVTKGSFIAQGSETCVSWDFTLQDWITRGCITSVGENGVVTCNCDHLTNFAILVDICLRQEDCQSSSVDEALTYISYIGISISIVCLVFTILTLLIFKKIRKKDVSKYHIQLCFALLIMFILTLILVTLSAEKVTTIYEGCVSLSLLVHYFTLVAVMWMGAEALLMFQKLVIVFVQITTKFIAFVSFICWTVPTIFVLIPFIVDLTNGHDVTSDIVVHQANMKDGISYCFLSHFGALMGAFLAPIFLILVINVVVFIWVVVVVIRHAREKATRIDKAMTNKQIMRLAISISGVLFLFGLSWLFFVLTFSRPGLRETFQILFTVFNSLQGFFIFAFILFTEGFDYWKTLLSCGKHKSKHSYPSRGSSIPINKQSTDLSVLSKQEKNTYAPSHNISTTEHKTDAETLITKDSEISTDLASPIELVTADTSLTTTVDQVNNIVYQNQDAIDHESANQMREFKKQTSTKPLNVLVKRYSTRKYNRHHVEEVKIDFYSEYSSSSDEDCDAANSTE